MERFRFFSDNLRGELTSVFPSTTASALTTLATGEPSLRHGVTGWFICIPELGSVSQILHWRPRHGGGEYPYTGEISRTLLRAEPIFAKLEARCLVVVPQGMVGSGYSRDNSRGAQVTGYNGLPGFCRAIDQH